LAIIFPLIPKACSHPTTKIKKNSHIKIKHETANSRKKKGIKDKEDLLGSLRVFVDFTRLLLALTLEMIEAVSMPLPVQLYVISLRLHKSNQVKSSQIKLKYS
jgi:hypothetical protein